MIQSPAVVGQNELGIHGEKDSPFSSQNGVFKSMSFDEDGAQLPRCSDHDGVRDPFQNGWRCATGFLSPSEAAHRRG
jgi:hypothetical protein